MSKQTGKPKLTVSYPAAQRVRARLLSDKVLSDRDRDTVLQILTDVYPQRRRNAARRRPQSHLRRPSYRRQAGYRR